MFNNNNRSSMNFFRVLMKILSYKTQRYYGKTADGNLLGRRSAVDLEGKSLELEKDEEKCSLLFLLKSTSCSGTVQGSAVAGKFSFKIFLPTRSKILHQQLLSMIRPDLFPSYRPRTFYVRKAMERFSGIGMRFLNRLRPKNLLQPNILTVWN